VLLVAVRITMLIKGSMGSHKMTIP
jgi:hypothetical protein